MFNHISYCRFSNIVNRFSKHAVAVGVKVVVSAGVTIARLLRLAATVAVEDILEVSDMLDGGETDAAAKFYLKRQRRLDALYCFPIGHLSSSF